MSGASARRFEGGRLVVASHNPGKVREIRDLLARFDVDAVSVGDFGLTAPDETEETYEGNARIKAHAAAAATGLPALADDSGFAIDALGGAPGVHAADWAETPTGRDFTLAMRKAHELVSKAAAPPPHAARFVCVLCLAWPDGHDEIFRGEVDGTLTWPPRGEKGFGYDPMFIRDGDDKTFGEIEPSEKHANSHRSKAFAELVAACFHPD